MPTKTKIKISDIAELREALDKIYDTKSQIELCKWALKLAEHILVLVGFDCENLNIVQAGFETNRKWQVGLVRTHDVRLAGFSVHSLSRKCKDPILQAALRVAGQAIGTAHMSEHAMVASDYAIKTVNLKFDDMAEVKREREWQIATLSTESFI